MRNLGRIVAVYLLFLGYSYHEMTVLGAFYINLPFLSNLNAGGLILPRTTFFGIWNLNFGESLFLVVPTIHWRINMRVPPVLQEKYWRFCRNSHSKCLKWTCKIRSIENLWEMWRYSIGYVVAVVRFIHVMKWHFRHGGGGFSWSVPVSVLCTP